MDICMVCPAERLVRMVQSRLRKSRLAELLTVIKQQGWQTSNDVDFVDKAKHLQTAFVGSNFVWLKRIDPLRPFLIPDLGTAEIYRPNRFLWIREMQSHAEKHRIGGTQGVPCSQELQRFRQLRAAPSVAITPGPCDAYAVHHALIMVVVKYSLVEPSMDSHAIGHLMKYRVLRAIDVVCCAEVVSQDFSIGDGSSPIVCPTEGHHDVCLSSGNQYLRPIDEVECF